MKKRKGSRREFLAETGKLAGSGWLAINTSLLLAAGKAAEEQQSVGAGWLHMTPQEADTFAAVVDQVIPPDDLPGASDAGVVYFIDQALGGFAAERAGLLRAGLTDLDRRARATSSGKASFAGLTFAQQTDILREIETTPFFNQMIFLTHCGMFAMPSRGGNRDRIGWKLLGFDDRHAWQPPFGFYDAEAMGEEGGHGE